MIMDRRGSRDSGVSSQSRMSSVDDIRVAKQRRKRNSQTDSVISIQSNGSSVPDEKYDCIYEGWEIDSQVPHDEGVHGTSGIKHSIRRRDSHTSDVLDIESEWNKYEQREKHYLTKVNDCMTKDPNLSEDQVKLILQSFSVLDENGDGKISKGEISRAYRLAGFNPTPTELEGILNEHDENNDGYIDFEEYFNVMRSKMIKQDFDKDRLKTAFKVLDMDQDGYITVEELRHALSKSGDHFTEQEIKDIIKAADKNHDGKIDYNEFVEADLCKSVF